MGKEKIYITGHKAPDLDSVVGAIAYAYLKKKTEPDGKEYIPTIVGKTNIETKYILEKFNIPEPEHLGSVAGKKVILVDHNEREQAIDDIDRAEILEIIDHHKMNFSYDSPIRIIIEPIGSSSSVIYKMFLSDKIKIPKDMAAIMLAAVLVDTVIAKSPTTTEDDLRIIKELSDIAEIKNPEEFGMEIFKVRSSVSHLSAEEIITADFKDFDIGGKKFGIGQVETVDTREFTDIIPKLLETLERKRREEKYHSLILFISDIIKEESDFLVSSEEAEDIAEAFGTEIEDNMFKAKILSRKKQAIPTLMRKFGKQAAD